MVSKSLSSPSFYKEKRDQSLDVPTHGFRRYRSFDQTLLLRLSVFKFPSPTIRSGLPVPGLLKKFRIDKSKFRHSLRTQNSIYWRDFLFLNSLIQLRLLGFIMFIPIHLSSSLLENLFSCFQSNLY